MTYQTNFASHHTHDRFVGFLIAWIVTGKHNKLFRKSLVRSDHNTKITIR